MDIGQPVVEPEGHHVLPPGGLPIPHLSLDAVIAKPAQLFGEVRVVGGDHPALPCGDVLDRMEAERGEVAQAPDPPAVPFRSQGVRRVLDDPEAAWLRDRPDPVHVAGKTREVDGQDRLRP